MVNAIEKYNSGGDETELVNEILALVKPQDHPTPASNKLKSVCFFLCLTKKCATNPFQKLTSPEDEMLAKRKKEGWHGKQHTIDNFVESVAEIHEPPKKSPASKGGEGEGKKEAAAGESSKLLGMKTCNIGQSPEVQPRELLNL